MRCKARSAATNEHPSWLCPEAHLKLTWRRKPACSPSLNWRERRMSKSAYSGPRPVFRPAPIGRSLAEWRSPLNVGTSQQVEGELAVSGLKGVLYPLRAFLNSALAALAI